MVDKTTLHYANGRADYTLTPLYAPDGSVNPHYLSFVVEHNLSWDLVMTDAHFSGIIDIELETERIANEPLASLASMAPSQRTRELYLRWLAFLNADLEPWTTGGAIHFRPHWARVLMLALNLGEREGLNDADLQALCMAAVFHDSRRADPYYDTGHGDRAAQYYAEFCRATSQGEPRRTAAGSSIYFDPRTYVAMAWHDRNDEDGVRAIETAWKHNALPHLGIHDVKAALPEGAQAEPVLLYKLFKDSDGLDRVRLGSDEPNPAYLRTTYALELLPYARELLEASKAVGA